MRARGSRDQNRVGERLIEEIPLFIEGYLVRLRIACGVRGSGHERVLAGRRFPSKLEPRPGVLRLWCKYARRLPRLAGVGAPLHLRNCTERRMRVAVEPAPACGQGGGPGERERTLDDLRGDDFAQGLAFRHIGVADEYIGGGVVARPKLLGGDDDLAQPLDTGAAHPTGHERPQRVAVVSWQLFAIECVGQQRIGVHGLFNRERAAPATLRRLGVQPDE